MAVVEHYRRFVAAEELRMGCKQQAIVLQTDLKIAIEEHHMVQGLDFQK
jgi:hypothetical protein